MAQTTRARSAFPSITRSQLAELLGVSEATIYRMIADGKAPPHYRIGSRRLWHEEDVREWLEKKCRQESKSA